jgi:hypothetical protein
VTTSQIHVILAQAGIYSGLTPNLGHGYNTVTVPWTTRSHNGRIPPTPMGDIPIVCGNVAVDWQLSEALRAVFHRALNRIPTGAAAVS